MQAARRRWSAVLIASSALAPKGACARLWLLQSGRHALCRGTGGQTTRVRAGSGTYTKVH
jgi:hypothetical protein